MIIKDRRAKQVAIVEFVVLGVFVVLFPILLLLPESSDAPTDVTIIIPAEPLAKISDELLKEHMTKVLKALDWDIEKSEYFEADYNSWDRPAREGFLRDLQEVANRHHLPLQPIVAEKAFHSRPQKEFSRSEQIELISKLIENLLGHKEVPRPKDYTNVLKIKTHKSTRTWIVQGLLHEFKRRKAFAQPHQHRQRIKKIKSWTKATNKDLRSETVEVIEKLEWNPSEQFMDTIQADWERSVREDFLFYITEILARRDNKVHPISSKIYDVGPKAYELSVIRALLIALIDKDPSSEFNLELDHFTAMKPREELFQYLKNEYIIRSKLTEDGSAAKRMVNRMVGDQDRAYWGQGTHSWVHLLLDYGNAGNTAVEIVVILLRLGCLISLNVILFLSIVQHGAGQAIIWAILHGGVTVKIFNFAITKIWMEAPVYYVITPLCIYIVYRLLVFYLITEFIFGDEKIMTTLRSVAVSSQVEKTKRDESEEVAPSQEPEQNPISV